MQIKFVWSITGFKRHIGTSMYIGRWYRCIMSAKFRRKYRQYLLMKATKLCFLDYNLKLLSLWLLNYYFAKMPTFLVISLVTSYSHDFVRPGLICTAMSFNCGFSKCKTVGYRRWKAEKYQYRSKKVLSVEL